MYLLSNDNTFCSLILFVVSSIFLVVIRLRFIYNSIMYAFSHQIYLTAYNDIMLPSSDVIHLLLVSYYGISVKKLLDRISNLLMYLLILKYPPSRQGHSLLALCSLENGTGMTNIFCCRNRRS
jgi:hypothetical protein